MRTVSERNNFSAVAASVGHYPIATSWVCHYLNQLSAKMKASAKDNFPAAALTFLLGTAAAYTLSAGYAAAQTPKQASSPADAGFSFAVYGDSRSMMYLPYKANEETQARELMADMFELVMPEKVAEEVVKKDVKLI